jgi:hypothetical protein
MRKTIIGGSLLVVLILLMLPAVTAEQAKIAPSTATSFTLNAERTYLEEIQKKFSENPSPQIIFLTLAIIILKLLRWGVIIIGGIFLLSILGIFKKPNNNTSVAL